MEPWTNEIKELYRIPSTYKEYRGYSNGELVFDGSNIVADSLTITQSISDSEQIKYGTVEASMLEVRLADSGAFPISIVPPSPIQLATDTAEPVYTALPENKKYMLRTEELKGAEIELKQVIGEDEVPIGIFIVDECTREADTWFIKIVAYDRLYRFRQDVSAWYNDPATWPYTLPEGNANLLGDLYASLCDYLGVPHDDLFISNDGKTIFKTIDPSFITGTDVLSAMCELNGCWPQMSPEGILRRVRLGADSCETFDYEVYDQTYRPESTREDFVCKAINAVVIRETEDDIGGHYPETLQDNPYIIQDNFLVYGRSTEDLEGFALNLYNTMKDKPYRPHNTVVDGRPYLQCGDKITVRTQKGTFDTYILKRTLKGEASLVDSYEAQGTEKQGQDYGISRQIIQLQSKTNKLIRTVDETVSEVANKVGNDEIISRINQTAEAIKIQAAKIGLEGLVTANNNFKILLDGSIETVNGKFSGKITSSEGGIAGMTLDYRGLTASNFRVWSYNSEIAANTITGWGISEFADILADSVWAYLSMSNYASFGSSYVPNVRVDTDTGLLYRTSHANSSVRYKKNIEDMDESWRGIYQLRPIIYALKDDPEGRIMPGLEAEAVYSLLPAIVETRKDNHGRVFPDAVDYSRLNIPMLCALQDINQRLTRLEEAHGLI